MIERRTFDSEVETRSAGANRLVIVGYAYKFGTLSGNLGGFRELVAEGAGNQSIKSDDIRGLLNHDPNLVLGRSTAGTLKLAEDSTGLHYEIDTDERQSYVRDLLVSLERGDITQSSFGFRVAGADGDSWEADDSGNVVRTLRAIKLFDVSPVTYPAYEASSSGLSRRNDIN